MSNRHLSRGPTPLLRTGPTTMLTAVGLCLILMLIQFVPEFQSMGSLNASSRVAATQQR